jgi:TolB-like protein/tetratricopeptide (TPR) repeat protein/predicted Ser/Thr protein kinase
MSLSGEDPLKPVDEGLTRWGHLVLRRALGQGSFGEVFLAWDPELDREVALKLMCRENGEFGIKSEARLLAKVRHENVAVVYGVAEHDERAGLWMEYIHGLTLDQLVIVQGVMGAQEATAVGMAVCRALAAVHQAGLLHCDIKAQNVMRAEGGRIVLMDFGLGQIFQQNVGTQLRGTVPYMALELFEGQPPSVQSDIYALGVMLYYLVSGSYPVTGATLAEVRENHRQRRAATLADVRPDLPESYLQVVARSTAALPNERFETAGQMLQALTSAWSPSQIPPSSIPQPESARQITRRKMLWGTAIGAGVIATGSAALFAKFGHWPWRQTAGAGDGYIHAIAVLPFENFSASPDSAYFSDGITEELINALTTLPGLRVVARASAFRFRGSNLDVRQIGKALNVDSIITGSIRRSDSEVRTAVQLVSTSDGSERWSEIYDLPLKDIFAVQEGIARRVADRLQVQFTPHVRTDFTEANDLYLRGLFHASKKLPSELRLAVSYFEQAVALKADYAKAWAALGETWLTLGYYDSRAIADMRAKAKPAIDRALELDANLAEGWNARGVYQFLGWDWKGAESSALRATSINPGYAEAWFRYASLLMALGRYQESLAAATRALDLDPVSATTSDPLGHCHYFLKEYDLAAKQYSRSLDLDPHDFVAHIMLGWVHLAMSEWAAGIAEMQTAVQISASSSFATTCLICANALSGKPDVARNLKQDAEKKNGADYFGPVLLGSIAASLGDRDTAFLYLNRAVSERDPQAVQFLINPALAPIRSDARFAKLLQSMNFPVATSEKRTL